MVWPVNGADHVALLRARARGRAAIPGIDIGVPSGTPIRAAAAGRVALLQSAGASGGYGNFTCIQHSGLAVDLLRATSRASATSMGASVSKGQVIGYVGLHRACASATTCTSRCASTGRSRTRWRTCEAGLASRGVQPGIDLLGLELKTFGLMFALAFVVSGLIVGRGAAGGRQAARTGPTRWSSPRSSAGSSGRAVVLADPERRRPRGRRRLERLLRQRPRLVRRRAGRRGRRAGVGGVARACSASRLLDICAPALALGYAVGRLGCQLAATATTARPGTGRGRWRYPDGTVPTDTPVHPTPLYETLAMGLVGLGAVALARRRCGPGCVFALYLVLAGLERFLVEFLRRNDPVRPGPDAPQWTAS